MKRARTSRDDRTAKWTPSPRDASRQTGDAWWLSQQLLALLVQATQLAIEQKHRAEAMRVLSLTDELTGLRNRRGFMVIARQQLRLGERTGRRMVLFVADVDGMKTINDTFGHHVGDEVLRRVARSLQRTFRGSDVLARLGGDEFAILAVDAATTNEQAIVSRLEQTIRVHGQGPGSVRVALSVGAVRFAPGRDQSLTELLRCADQGMYSRKLARGCSRRGADQPLGDIPS